MNKKDYEKPAMQVFELKHQPTLLAGSYKTSDAGSGTGVNNYNWNNVPEE